ncbi:MAG: hypothetical protein AAGF54_20700 [Pseudomonadota bacterium]
MFIAEAGVSGETPEGVKKVAEQAAETARNINNLPASGDRSGVDYGTEQSGAQRKIVPPAGAELEQWDVQAHQYRTEIGGNVTLLARLFSGKGNVVLQGVVQEAKRYRVVKSEDGYDVEVGCAVRLTVATSSKEFSAKLTVANLAASAQLDIGNSDVRVALSVSGFCGPLGSLIPSPTQLNVENFAEYTQAFSDIQKHVFGEKSLHYLRPTYIGHHLTSETDRST